MTILMVTLAVLFYTSMVWCMSAAPRQSRYSLFERTRRRKARNTGIDREIQRAAVYGEVSGLLRIGGLLAAAAFSWAVLMEFEWAVGLAVVVVGVLLSGMVARVTLIRRGAQRVYDRYENRLLEIVERHQRVFRMVRAESRVKEDAPKIASKEEFIHISDSVTTILTKDERRQIRQGLSFSEVQVSDIMTPRSAVECVKKGDIVGPLLLDELHKTGHSRFPVIDGDIDHVVGILHIRNLLQLHDKKTHEASNLMMKPVYYIKEVQTAHHALAAFLRTHNHVMIVVNEARETVGIITLEDTIEVLLGRNVIDEFDAHEDLPTVAARNLHDNNQASPQTDG